MTDTIMKTCTKCGMAKGLECFSKHPKGLLGVLAQCKKCRSAANSLRQKEEVENLSFRYLAKLEGRHLGIDWKDVPYKQVIARRDQIIQRRTMKESPSTELACSGCSVLFPTDEFPFHSGRRLRKCKACVASRNKEYKVKHAAEIAAWSREYKAINADRISARRRSYWVANKDRYYQTNNAWREKNPGRFLEIRRRIWMKQVSELSLSYVRGQLAKQVGTKSGAIPESLAELAAINLKIKRLLRQRKQP